jgi:hypothetical protein
MKKYLLIILFILLGVALWVNAQEVSRGLPELKWIDGKPRISSMPYLYDLAEGLVSGHTPWTKIGQSTTATTNTEDVWPVTGTYYPPTSGVSMQVYSTSANDTSTGGGIRTVTVYYLDTNYLEKEEILTLGGLSAVTTVATNIFRVNGFRAATVGGLYAAAGDVSLRHHSGVTVYGRILTGYTRGRNPFFTVPANQTLYVTPIMFSSSLAANKSVVLFTTRATYNDKSKTRLDPLFYMPFHETYVTDNTFFRELEIPTRLPEKVDLKVSVKSSSASALCSTALRGWLESNN